MDDHPDVVNSPDLVLEAFEGRQSADKVPQRDGFMVRPMASGMPMACWLDSFRWATTVDYAVINPS
ncbi:hypothetical protein [Streptomyces sp. NPDC050704]|uniref:hypothetical protein n=1 Tax=Streptomyces sp. NPDC050704 TaxID=3157219 RepID=UPI00341C6040